MVNMIPGLVFAATLIVQVFRLIGCAEVDQQCIPLRDCPELLNLLKGNPPSAKAIKHLKASQCGFDGNHPKVWCTIPNCKTPNEILGTCKPIKTCEPVLQLIKSISQLSGDVKSYLQKFECENPNSSISTLSVCCPLNNQSLIAEPIPLVVQPNPSPVQPNVIMVPNPLMIQPNPPNVQPTGTLPTSLPRPAEGNCGRQLVSKIYGGKVTDLDEFPWTALLEYDFDGELTTGCDGSLINNKYVVTAAHCVDTNAIRRGRLANVILGEYDIKNETDCITVLGITQCSDPPVKVPVDEIIIHPQWYKKAPNNINHDIALLKLTTAVTFTDYIHPICLPSPTLTLKGNERLVVTGWGETERGLPSSVKLKTTVPVANRVSCLQRYKAEKRLVVGEGEICAGGEQGMDSCSGDSGGPLMLSVDRNGNSFWFLVGVVSFGPNKPCGVKDYPALYTYLPKYVDWIYKTIQS